MPRQGVDAARLDDDDEEEQSAVGTQHSAATMVGVFGNDPESPEAECRMLTAECLLTLRRKALLQSQALVSWFIPPSKWNLASPRMEDDGCAS